MAIDPVCKMTVDEKTAKFKTEYKGDSVRRAARKPLRRTLKSTWDRTVQLEWSMERGTGVSSPERVTIDY